MALTARKRKYAAARVAGFGKKASAVEAGCPKKTAQQAASRYERDTDVTAFMAKLREAPAKMAGEVIDGAGFTDPLAFMRHAMNNSADERLRLDAAKALASFTVMKPGEAGKKAQKKKRADEARDGRFKPAPMPQRMMN